MTSWLVLIQVKMVSCSLKLRKANVLGCEVVIYGYSTGCKKGKRGRTKGEVAMTTHPLPLFITPYTACCDMPSTLTVLC